MARTADQTARIALLARSPTSWVHLHGTHARNAVQAATPQLQHLLRASYAVLEALPQITHDKCSEDLCWGGKK